MPSSFRTRPLEWMFLALLVFSIIWKGGKSIDSTWISALTVPCIFLCGWIADRFDPDARSKRLQEYTSPSWIHVLSLLIITGTILSYCTSETRNYGLDEVIRTITYLLAFLWILRLREQGKEGWIVNIFPYIVSLTALVAAFAGIFVYLLQPVTRFAGTFVDPRFHTDYWPNAWAEFLLIALPMIFLSVLRSPEKKMRWMAGFILLLTTLYLSYSRGGILAFGGEVLLFLIIGTLQARNNIPLQRYLRMHAVQYGSIVLGCLFLVGIFAVSLNAVRSLRFDVESISQKVVFKASEGTSSVNERAAFWQEAALMIREKPLLGYGPYSFRFVQPARMTSVLATSDHPHNAFLKMASERGLPTALFFAALIIGILLSALRKPWKTDPISSLPTTAALLAIVGVLLHVMIDYNLQFVGIGLPFFVLLGFLAPLHTATDARRSSFLRWKTRRRLGDIAAFIATVLIVMTVREGWFLVTSSFGRHALAAGETKAALEWFNLSENELYSRDLFLGQAQIYLQDAATGSGLLMLDRYQELNTHDARAWRLRGEALLIAGRTDDAIVALQHAYNKGRYADIGILRLLLEAFQIEGKGAIQSKKQEFDAHFRIFADAVNQNTHFIALSTNVEELVKVARLLSDAFPADATRYHSIAKEAQTHAKKERLQYSEKTLGILW